METKIKTLLKLEQNPYYKLSEKDRKILEEWKLTQAPAKIKRFYKKKATNEVKVEEKETGELEIAEPVQLTEDLTLEAIGES